MRSVFIAALAWAASTAVVAAKPADGPSRQFRGADLFALQAASDPQVRPDGGQIAYVRVGYDLMNDRAVRSVWLVDPATGAQVPLAGAAGSQSSPRWSPDGKRLAYVFTAEGGKPGLYVRWMANGAAVRVADLPETPGALAWSPDGRQIAFTMFVPDDGAELGSPLKKPEGAKWADPLKVITKIHYREDGEGYLRAGYSKVFVVDADGGAARQLSFGAYDDDGRLAWTQDGKAILFSSNRGPDWERNPQDSDIFRVDLADGRLTQLTHRYGPDAEPAVSPDGRLVAYLGFDDKLRSEEDVRVYLMAPDGSGSRSLTDGLDRSVQRVEWAADGKSLLIQYDDAGLAKVARLGLDGKIEPVADHLAGTGYDRPYTGGAFSVGGGGLVAFTQGGPEGPPDLAVAGRGGPRRLTHLNADLLQARDLGAVQHLDVKSSADGRPIDAWLVTPANFDPGKKYPLILEIHGGPFDAYGPSFSTDDQLYAAAGYVVLYANPRGSTSYGAEFANLIHHAYPGQDYDDLMSAVDAAIARGFVDSDQMFVTGGSGGGVLTAWIVGKTTRFRAAAVQKPVIDWASFALTSDNTAFFAKYWFGKMPWEDPQGYWSRSPLSLVGNVKTPTMVVVGEQDFRTPDSEAEQYYSALQLRGVPTALVKVPGASHGGLAGRPSQSAAKASAILAWFERYRGK
jgi:dipeptidyl aminopeptidase/acylaminoacyl peptidase